MVRGLYTSASGALVAESMADNVANNLANVDTSGFKQTLLQIQSAPTLDIYRIQTDPGKTAGNPLPGTSVSQEVGQLGTGALVYDTPTNYDQGSLQTTGNPLDVAITGTANASSPSRRQTAFATRATASSRRTGRVFFARTTATRC